MSWKDTSVAEVMKIRITHAHHANGITCTRRPNDILLAHCNSNMVNPGKDCPKTYTCDEIGEATVAVLRRVMPAAMPVSWGLFACGTYAW
jgi:hypothetical protein